MDSVQPPKDDVERSFAQYYCQKKLFGKRTHFFSCAAAVVFLLPKLLLTSFSEEKTKSNGIFVSENIPENVIPNELKEEVGSIVPIKQYNLECFDKEDRRFFFRLWKRHPFALPFLFKCLIKIRLYSALIKKYDPKVIITCNEFSYTSSVLTLYCEEKGVEHVDVMHGEKLFYIRDSFFRFHRCYVWSQNYVDLFLRMRAEESQFRVAVPPSLLFEKTSVTPYCDYTYYLQEQSGDELKCIVTTMKTLVAQGNKVVFRPHPRFTPMKELKELCGESGIEIEKNAEISIEESVLRTGCVISLFSTVLQQAHYNKVPIAIDDISDPIILKKLQDRGYAMIQAPHQKLSELLEIK